MQTGGDFNVVNVQPCQAYHGDCVMLEKKGKGVIEYQVDSFDLIQRFTREIFPHFRITDDNKQLGRRIGKDALKTLVPVNKGSFGMGSTFTDKYGRQFMIKYIHPHIVSYDYEAAKTELDKTVFISGVMPWAPNDPPETIIKTYAAFDFSGKNGFATIIYSPPNLVDSDTIKEITESVSIPVAGLIQEQGDFDMSNLFNEYAESYVNVPIGRDRKTGEQIARAATISWYLKQLVKGIQYIHGNNYIHSDIKPANLIIKVMEDKKFPENLQPKFIDFGLLTSVPEGERMTQLVGGTPNYLPQEVHETNYISYSADIFALGLTIIEHFELTTDMTQFNSIPEIGFVIQEIIDSMVSSNPAKRPSPENIYKGSKYIEKLILEIPDNPWS